MSNLSPELRAALANSHEMFFFAATDKRLIHESRALSQRLGTSPGEVTSLEPLVHSEDKAAFTDAWARSASSAGEVEVECRLRAAGNAFRKFSIHLHRVAEGGDSSIYGTLQLAEGSDAPRIKEEILQSLVQNLPIVVWAVDKQGIFTFQEGKALDATGLSGGEFVGKSMFDIYAELPDVLEQLRQSFTGTTSQSSTLAHGTAWDTWQAPLRTEHGEITGVVGVSLDVTDTKRIEDELRAKLAIVQKQQEVIRALSTPIIEVWDGVLTLPMVGMVDSMRAAEMMDNLLQQVTRTRARFAILDITGVDAMDTATASHLLKLVRALSLLGAEGIVTGIHPSIAQTMVGIGVDLSNITTLATLRDALKLCMTKMASAARRGD